MGVLMVASEAAPWAKTGGLADVVGALPAALEALGHRVTVVMPRYRQVAFGGAVRRELAVRLGHAEHRVDLESLTLSAGRRVVFVDYPAYFDRDGLYGAGPTDYPDNAHRFGLLAVAALQVGEDDRRDWPVDVVHAHDWQAGLVPTLLQALPGRWPGLAAAARVLTIHNLAYQGVFTRDVVPALGLPWQVFGIDGGEFWGRFNFLKAGINAADFLTTVSPTYARETQTPAFGAGLDGVLAARADRYQGILNGIDTAIWDPATDPHLPAHYDASDLSGKRACKRALLARLGLPVGDDALARPLAGMVSRLVEQKGLDLIGGAQAELAAFDATWVFVGTGDPVYEQMLRALAVRHPSRVAVHVGFDEDLAHLVEAGADVFLMPSRFEPCGLNQLYSLRYGTVPVVHAVGGLADTVQPHTTRARHATGFLFREATPEALVRAVRQALRVYRDAAAWHQLIEHGMAADHSWARSAREYVRVYRRARYEAAARAAP